MKATLKVYQTHHSFNPEGDPVMELSSLHYHHGQYDMTKHGWIEIGTAEIDMTPLPAKDILQAQVQVLKDQKLFILAEAQLKATQIEERIQSLLALPCL